MPLPRAETASMYQEAAAAYVARGRRPRSSPASAANREGKR